VNERKQRFVVVGWAVHGLRVTMGGKGDALIRRQGERGEMKHVNASVVITRCRFSMGADRGGGGGRRSALDGYY